MNVLLHDLQSGLPQFMLPGENGVVFYAGKNGLPCKGCFHCWLKNPGFCVIPDELQHAGALLGNAETLTIVTRNCFGGYSPAVKTVLDRGIGLSLPLFTYRGKKTHHVCRYPGGKQLTVLFYGDSTPFERETARALVEQNRLNFGFGAARALFAPDAARLGEAAP